ncbi:MAG: ABC transporter permease [Oscillospiraceae bacterium]
MSLTAFTSSIELGLFYSLMTLGLFISYRILDIADLTVDGSFTLGAAVCAMVTISGHPILAIVAAGFTGALAGIVTAFLQTKLKIQPILSGILTMTGLYSINIMVMGGSANKSLNGQTTIISLLKNIGIPSFYISLILGLIVATIAGTFIIMFLQTQTGLSIRATGDNEDMVRSSSINVNLMKTIGLSMANMLVAISGAFIAQYQSFADVSSGVGMVVIGLASLIIGEIIFGKKSIKRNVIAVIFGSIIYRFIISIALEINISFSSMKLVSAIIITLAISFPVIKENIKLYQLKKRSKISAEHN